MKECKEHDKVYANRILTSAPPQRPWICRTCGERGTDQWPVQRNEYDELVEQVKTKNENEK